VTIVCDCALDSTCIICWHGQLSNKIAAHRSSHKTRSVSLRPSKLILLRSPDLARPVYTRTECKSIICFLWIDKQP